MKKNPISLTVNDEACEFLVAAHWTLLDVLRDELDLTGTKEGCSEGACGSCTVLMDGRPIRACLTLALEATGTRITTVEGLATESGLDPLQQAFIDHGAVQCGFCTSGMLVSAKALLSADPDPDENTVKQALSGNICRCTGYTKIVEAVSAVARTTKAKR